MFCVGLHAETIPSVVRKSSSLCQAWSPATEVGKLDGLVIDEASGIVVSRIYDRIYWANDSGDGPYVYVTDRKGELQTKITIKGFKPFDVEAMSWAACPGTQNESCLAVADIGDNRERRKSIEIVFIREQEKYEGPVDPIRRLRLKYPDHAHNAEAFQVLPNGDLIIVTKEFTLRKMDASAAEVFRLPASAFVRESGTPQKPLVLDWIGKIDVPALTRTSGLQAAVTDMSLSSDGRRVLLLTYFKALEIEVDFSSGSVPHDLHYKLIDFEPLEQQETVAYDRNDRDFFFSSERVMGLAGLFMKGKMVPLMKVNCK
jgi:hypothetical protein